ncbi:hypothetical protein ACFX2F_035117 [Malus domestica]
MPPILQDFSNSVKLKYVKLGYQYLVDYACFKPPVTCRVPFSTFMEHSCLNLSDNPKSVEFQMRILERSGLGDETCLPPAIHYIPPNPTMEAARGEAELVKKTGLKPKDIDILIVNCSLFSPTPLLSAMVINKYKLRSNIKSLKLSSMGCSAGLISIDLARDLLQVHPNSHAVVVSTEIITPNYYQGNERAMLLPNCLFRMGGAALLLSNRGSEHRRTKYRLVHVVRTHKGADDKVYRCVFEEDDKDDLVSVVFSTGSLKRTLSHYSLHSTSRTALCPSSLGPKPSSPPVSFVLTPPKPHLYTWCAHPELVSLQTSHTSTRSGSICHRHVLHRLSRYTRPHRHLRRGWLLVSPLFLLLISDGGYGLTEAAGLVEPAKPATEKGRLKSKQVVRMVVLPEACRTMKFVAGLLTTMLIDGWWSS